MKVYIIKNKGTILIEAVLSLAFISIVILPVFSQTIYILRLLEAKNIEEGEEYREKGILKGIGFSLEKEVELVRYWEEKKIILVTERERGICP